jgi:hypothetical protein
MLASFPATIAGFVTAIVVDAANACAGRTLAHVGKEVFEDQPSFANGDASSSIARPTVIVGVGASLDHLHPRAVGWRSFALRNMSVFKAVRASNSPATATGFFVGLVGRSFVSAIATDEPDRSVKAVHVREAKDGLLSKAQTRDITKGRHCGSSYERRCLGAASVSALCRPAFVAQLVLQ